MIHILDSRYKLVDIHMHLCLSVIVLWAAVSYEHSESCDVPFVFVFKIFLMRQLKRSWTCMRVSGLNQTQSVAQIQLGLLITVSNRN